ncbi:MAG: TonB-dependent receptor [Flavobacteriaceae bacterium]|nr:TonB-dependent receptor [Flavobacteriaceae bacterium]
MNKIILTALALLIITAINAQQRKDFSKKDIPKFEITGTVFEKNSNQPLEFATIIFKPLKGKRVFGGLTDNKGKFNIEVPKGIYNINIEFLSFKTNTIESTKIDQDINLGKIYLEEDAQSLDEVELIAEKSTVEIRLDKKIYNVGKDMTVKGGTASDVLDNVPSVTVDVDGVVSLRGNENVKILINGKPSGLVGLNDTEALRQFPADAIKKVEVITSPSARYESEGTAGILNIILRQGKMQGFNGSATVNAGIPENYGFSTNLNYRLKKINFFTNIGYSYRNSPGNAYYLTENLSPNATFPFSEQNIDYTRVRKNLNTNFGLEYFINSKTSLTANFLFRNSDRENEVNNNTDSFDQNMVLEQTDLRIENENRTDNFSQFGLNFTKEFKEDGHKLTFDGQYQDNDNNEFSIITNEQTFPVNSLNPSEEIDSDQSQQKILLQGDYVLPIGEKQQFEAGFRSNINTQTTDYKYFNEDNNGDFILNDDLSNIFNYDENIYALYSQYGNKFGNISALFGLRMETTDIEIKSEGKDFTDVSNKNYTDFFPTLNLAYEFSESENITLGYNRRIRRPRSHFINPFPSQSSKTTFFQGNPDLDPSISNGIDIGYYKRWSKITFNTSIYYNHSTDVWQFISEDTGEETDDGLQIIRRTPINLSTNDRIGYEFSLNYTPIKKWRFNTSFNLYNSTIKGEYNDIDYGSKNISWFARFSSKIVLPANIDWQTTMMYRGPSENSQSKRDGVFMTNMAFSKDIFKGNGTISFNVDDLFNTRKRTMETFTDTFHQTSEFQWRERQFRLSFAYRFKQKKKRQRQGGMNGGGGEENFGG